MAEIRGVNLGGWLVLERWMTPSVFDGTDAKDETELCSTLGSIEAIRRIKAHRNSFIKKSDLVWLKSVGINSVRIPVGHWLFGESDVYVEGSIDNLDNAIECCAKLKIKVMIDLHAAPGCQNGFDNGGMLGTCDWHTSPKYREQTILLLGKLAERYGNDIFAIQPLNEPRWDIPSSYLLSFYNDAYREIRKYSNCEIVFSDAFRAVSEFKGMPADAIFDTHKYQCFVELDLKLNPISHVKKVLTDWVSVDENDHYLGEWSLGMDLETVCLWSKSEVPSAIINLKDYELDITYRAYAAAQLLAFEKCKGWYFWSYKNENAPAWNFRECVKRGWLPKNFGK